ncbi:hypothetical protein LOK49_LG07G02348 [Camellia lanceoleosa]|uniref:Uncharacterized protein n=1 Tax=Camellia lanceoleosa TaxID=1840588 RepID=A0ACC0GXW2_9ERIC|nr:hypothetical protein LOK49_LG07G02348 [Camellia lanceoleosa]
MADSNIVFEDGYTISTVINGHEFHINPCSILPQFGSSRLLTDLRLTFVNNDCYAQSIVKFGLHKHILHASQSLHKDIVATVQNFEQLSLKTTFGWESETTFPKVLGHIIESLAEAILIDSGYNNEVVLQSKRPLLEPMITPKTSSLI